MPHGMAKLKKKKESSCQCREQRFSPWSEKIAYAAGQPSSSAATMMSVLYRVHESQLLNLRVTTTEGPKPGAGAPQ